MHVTSASDSVLLLTGATGVVGGELLLRFAARPSAPRIIALCRKSLPEAPAEVVWGDIRQPRLGLEPETYRRLQARVTQIIHCAADTRFGLPLDAARETNTRGAERVLEFARGCRRIEKLAHISTVYVAGNRTGAIAEEFAPAPPRFFNTYQQSKHEAEELVERAARELPVMLFRLSSLAGDSSTGQIRRFNYVHQLIRLLPRNLLAKAPGDPSSPLDLIPTDYAGAALPYIFQRRFTPGLVCQICAGPEASLTLQEMVRTTVEAYAAHPAGRRYLPIQAPKFVPLEEYERYAREQQQHGSALLRQVLRGLGHFLPHLALRQHFANANTRRLLEGSGIHLPPVAEYFPKVVAYCLEISRS